ncbi:UNVERIFIED_CONTAM: hypothetical protein Sangu_0970100 [Sesamum angustifolium]|uniref:Uncharacterized protein n=1 Tax=Sesamum angustifolium TaxID=2727405 RepID=A0AAW2PG05_9LAMI
MAKIPTLRFTTEVAPPKFISVVKPPLIRILDTIDEDKAYASAASLSFNKLVVDRERYRREVSQFE